MTKKALVTGAAGYIGRILCRILELNGWEVVGVDMKWESNFPCNTYWSSSYDDPVLYENEKYDVIFHLAANSLLGPSVENPLDYFDNNVCRLNRMLQHIVENKSCENIIFASSAATYGDPNKNIALKEEHAGQPCNPYGWSKLMGEHILEQACLAHGIKAYAMRFFNVTGSYANLGQDLDQPHILTKMCQAAIKNETFYINGNNYNTGDGTCVRDYVHVYDVCQALIAAAKQIQKDLPRSFTEYNVGCGVGYSNHDIARFVRMHMGLNFEFAPNRPGDPGYLYCDNTAIRQELDWQPVKTISEIIDSHYEYVKANLNEQNL